MIALEELNAAPAADFERMLGMVFEHSPWVAARAAAARPFASRLQLLDAMRAVVNAARPDEQLALIRAHPQLGARGRSHARLTAASAREQHRAGLDACSDADFERLAHLNTAYLERFGMPFILAVRGHDPASILATFERRLANDGALERHTALRQIGLIAAFRLADIVGTPAEVEARAMAERLNGLAARGDAAEGAGSAGDGAGTTGEGAGTSGSQAAEWVREWMQAAALTVSAAGDDCLLALQRADESTPGCLLIGVHYDASARAVRYDGSFGFLIGIAVTQELRQRGTRLPFDLLILARPRDERTGEIASLADPDTIRGCTALTLDEPANEAREANDAHEANEAAPALTALRAGGMRGQCLVMVRQGRAGIVHRPEPPLDVNIFKRATRALEDFLLQTHTASDSTRGASLHGWS